MIVICSESPTTLSKRLLMFLVVSSCLLRVRSMALSMHDALICVRPAQITDTISDRFHRAAEKSGYISESLD